MSNPKFVELGSPEFNKAVWEALAAGAPTLPSQAPPDKKWYRTKDAFSLLNFPSAQALNDWRDRMGRNIREGVHYRKTGKANARRHNYEWHVPKCQELLSIPRHKLR